MNSIFYFVFRINGGAPTYRHETYSSALYEAQRLAERNGGEFVVLEAKAIVKPTPKTQTVELVNAPMTPMYEPPF